jgi:DGQHR domain-containing protein
MTTVTIPVLPVEQPIGSFYIGVVEARDLYAISYADVRRKEGRDIERYIGTQRDLSEGRVAEIKRYVKNVDACFPTGVILSVEEKHAKLKRTPDGQLAIELASDEGKVAKIIDGQHRIAGFEEYSGAPFFLNVTIFVDMELEDQAMVFATINLKQTKVTKSLAYDLYEFAEARSPQKTCHNIAKTFNFKDGSPLQGFIKILGKSSDNSAESITQAAFVDRIMKLITRHPDADKDLLKRGKHPAKAEAGDKKKLLFRNLFLDKDDAKIAFVLWEYFWAVELRWPGALGDRNKGMILGRTTGFAALVRLLPELMVRLTRRPLDEDTSEVHRDEILALLNLIKIDATRFNSQEFLPGSTGEGDLFKELLQGIAQKPERWTGGFW